MELTYRSDHEAALRAGGYSALIAGATGMVGSVLLEELMADAGCEALTVIARSPAPERLLARPGAEKLRWIAGDLERLEETLAGVSADRVFCALGTTIKQAKTRDAFRRVDLDYPLALGRWAERSGAAVFALITAMGADERSPFFYSRVKGEAERRMAELAVPNIVFLRPSLLLGHRSAYRRGEQWGAAISARTGFLFAGPLKRYKPIAGADVAAVMRYAAGEAASGRLERPASGASIRGNAWITKRHANGARVIVLESDAIAAIAREILR